MVFYFTATGNSLYVAKQLEQKPVSIPQAIHENTLLIEDETIGVVCPVYGHEMPGIVKTFLEKAAFHTGYFYLVLTYGKIHGGAAELAGNFLSGIGKEADYINTIVMVDNFLPSFDMEEQCAIDKDKQVDAQIAAVTADIKARKRWKQPVTQEDRDWHRTYLDRQAKLPAGAFMNLYHVTDACIGCGICVKVCPTGCLELVAGKAVHRAEGCQTCMACIHHCPQKAIGLNVPEPNPNARYRNEHITLEEIIRANQQNL
ncbi:EFR1 family ferrodoxin [Harryflintia acetispora]|uniref:EFR1 family ferrodoxin n=1 Tax=Harryflintia acetispora TaxID=1849041 RepID=UPI0018972F3C|nr:EFR1 family ferrodoxin [Harryflintia acetispora]